MSEKLTTKVHCQLKIKYEGQSIKHVMVLSRNADNVA